MVRLPVHAYRLSKSIIKIQIICLLALILALPAGVWAKPTTPEQARTVVENWLALDSTPLGAPLGPQIKEVKTYNHQDTPAYYVVYLNPAGFVIVSADDMVEPIIGFLPEGQYDPSPDNPLGAMVSQDLPGRVLAARQMEKQVQTEGLQLAPTNVYAVAQRKWAMLAKGSTATEASEFGLPSISTVWVAPLVQSTWDQSLVSGSACYNYYTPPYAAGSASNYVCGCVATAMAQLMRFWSYPTAGVGTGSYTISIDGTPTTRNLRGGDGAGGPYNWGSMPLVPNSSITTTQRQAIGALTADAGVSVNMGYTGTSAGSGTDTLKASTALVNTFGYGNAKNGYSGSSTSSIPAANRNNMVNPNLDAGFPTLLGIRSTAGGHAIVCDGYGYNTATLYHHLNMGWSGSDNAWYNLPTVDTSWTTFDVQYKVIYNVYKTGSGEIVSGRVTNSGGTPISGVTVTATGSGGPYTATTNAKGIYALPKVASGATYSVSASKTGYTFTPNPQSVATGTSTNLSTTTGNKWGINFVGVVVPPTNVLFDNGPWVNSPGTGAGGADESVVQTSLGLTTYGFSNYVAGGYRIAEDFTLTTHARINKIKFYAYQTGSTTTSTITAVNLRIWDGPPNNSASKVIYGDTTTNRMTDTKWSNTYRVLDTAHGDTQRPVMVNTASINVTLGPGTYWLDWQTDGSLSSGPWAPPITKNGQITTGNALQYNHSTSSWVAVLDGGTSTQQGFPFIIEGEGGGDITPILLLLLN
ncbi:MAG: C10 family peptidase [Proteobacteria bacterium]|nr:C10 family peptidase [Pseudomonadota bacterium]